LLAIDHYVIDGAVRLVGWVISEISNALRGIQNGYVRSYALMMLIGLFISVFVLWAVTA